MNDKKYIAIMFRIIAGVSSDKETHDYIKPLLSEDRITRKEYEGVIGYNNRMRKYAVNAACQDLAELLA